MPRSLQDILDHADELADAYEHWEPAPGEPADGRAGVIADLRAAVVAEGEARRAVASAVYDARSDGLSWTAIGLILGTSSENARRQYGERPPKPKGRATKVAKPTRPKPKAKPKVY